MGEGRGEGIRWLLLAKLLRFGYRLRAGQALLAVRYSTIFIGRACCLLARVSKSKQQARAGQGGEIMEIRLRMRNLELRRIYGLALAQRVRLENYAPHAYAQQS